MKITLLGDSIRAIGYGKMVPSLLGESFEVYQPEENCRFSKYTLRGICDWRIGMEGSRIVHWNNGLWDVSDWHGDGVFTPLEEYLSNMRRIADCLLKNHEKVIFATITPVHPNNPVIRNENIELYNRAVVFELKKKGVIINDLHALLKDDIPKYIRSDDHTHLTDEGITACAEQVASMIRLTAGDM